MSAIAGSVLAAIVARLAAAPTFRDWTVEHTRLAPIAPAQMPRVVVTGAEMSMEPVWTGRLDVTLTVTIELVRAARVNETDMELGEDMFRLAGVALDALAADPTLGGLTDDIEPSTIEVTTELGSPTIGAAAVTVTVSTGVQPTATGVRA